VFHVTRTASRAKPRVVNVAEAKAHLPELIECAANGEEIILARAGKPRARLVPLADSSKQQRIPGKGRGRFKPARNFDEPLPPAVLALFEGQVSMEDLP
jgi:prevent-host-death family protein